MARPDEDDETYSEEETERRREAALKRMLSTPPTPHTPAKGKKRPRGRPKKQEGS